MEVEECRWDGVAPVSGVGKREGAEASLVPDDGGREKLRVGEGVNLSGEGVLRKTGGKKIQGGVRGVAGGGLEKRKGVGERSSGNG